MNFFAADLDKITIADVEDFLAIRAPEEQRPTEGLRIDYKLQQPADFPETVAAFANGAGGLLFIGVESKKKKHNIPTALPGDVFVGGDVRARITGKILSQVTPRPEIKIGVAPLPQQNDKVVLVVRVAPGNWPPYEFTMQDKVRIPVRIQDTNRQATLREIEQMIQRRETFAQSTEDRLAVMNEQKPLVPNYIGDTLPDGSEFNEATQAYQTWIVRPRASLRVRLDRNFENQVMGLVANHFPEVRHRLGHYREPLVTANTHVLRWQAKISNQTSGTTFTCARRLELTSDGGLRYSEKIDTHDPPYESVSDLLILSMRFLRFAADFYRTWDYFGSLSVLQRIDSHTKIRIHANFPDAGCNYIPTTAIRFSGQDYSDVEPGSSRIVREITGLEADDIRSIVLDFTLCHLRQLCRASVDYDELDALLKAVPDRPCFYDFR